MSVITAKKEANRIKKTVKFATTPSPPTETLTNETGTNTMVAGDNEYAGRAGSTDRIRSGFNYYTMTISQQSHIILIVRRLGDITVVKLIAFLLDPTSTLL